jgi:tellurite resistance protein
MLARIASIRPAHFSIAVGVLAWAQLWRTAAATVQDATALATAMTWLGLSIWAGLSFALAAKWVLYREQLRSEVGHPGSTALSALIPISTLLAAVALRDHAPQPARLLFLAGIVGAIILGLWVHGRYWKGERPLETVTADIYLPTVAQNLVASTTSAAFRLDDLALLFFGAGLFSWLALESLVTVRATQHATMPIALRPTLGIQMAPAAVGGLAYLASTQGPPDLLAKTLFGYALYQAALALRLLPWISRHPFSPAYWSFSFGTVALATMAVLFHQRMPGSVLWESFARLLFPAANLALLTLSLLTAGLAWKRAPSRTSSPHRSHS